MGKKVNIICAGKIKERFINEGIAEYAKRLSRFCTFNIIEVADFPDNASSAASESALILPKMQGAYNILTDIHGDLITSQDLSTIIEKAYLSGSDTVNFIIGGSNGVDERVKTAAQKIISFGRITHPHKLMRLILTEQIYRAFTITANSPYHK